MKFNYQARTKTGEIQTGIVEASSKDAALDLLQKYQLFVTAMEGAGDRPFYAKKVKLFSRVSAKDLVAFSRQLSLMFKAKISLVQSLKTLAEQTRNQDFKEKILTISEDVEGGAPFSQAIARFPKLFSAFFVNMVKSGEASGTLSESLDYLADHLEKEYNLFSKLKSAMIYPILIVFVSIAVLTLMMYFVIPNLARVFEESEQELPLVTKVVIGLSDFLRSWGWAVLIFLVIALYFALRYLKTPAGRSLLDRFLLKVPFIRTFLKMIYITRFAENLSTLIAGGLPITQSLEITGEVVGSSVYREKILETKDEVRQGRKISGVLAKYPEVFPPLLTQMVAVGEKTGALDQSLLNVVNFYEKEVERSIETLLSLMEPLLIIFLGLGVAGLMGSVLLPMYKMTTI